MALSPVGSRGPTADDTRRRPRGWRRGGSGRVGSEVRQDDRSGPTRETTSWGSSINTPPPKERTDSLGTSRVQGMEYFRVPTVQI